MAEHLSVADRAARGRAARSRAPRSSHGEWAPSSDRCDPIELLERQARSRVPALVPIRHGRMAASPFAFFRGAAMVMAADLAATPDSGLPVQLCGDAHLSNFGGFAAPDRRSVFDLNDFDETLPGPWEWDLKRLAASLAVAGRERGFGQRARRRVVHDAVGRYRDAMQMLATMSNLAVWYARVDIEATLEEVGHRIDRRLMRRVERNTAKARHKDSFRAFSKLTRMVDGEPRLVSDPPLLVPVDEMIAEDGPGDRESSYERIRDVLSAYRGTLSVELRELLESYRYVDAAHKVVGVGSVGTRAWIVLLAGRDHDDPLFLQLKEAQRSVLEPFLGPGRFKNQGRRVVEGQRLMQASGDIMLGWVRTIGIDGEERDFYVRQLWDWKQSADVDSMDRAALGMYAELCAATLARAHARSGDRVAIAAYLGRSDRFPRALAEFAELYADQNERDHRALLEAIHSGRLEAQAGI